MKKQTPLHVLSLQDLKEISSILETRQYQNNAKAIHQGHIPEVGIILLEGPIRLIKEKKIQIFQEQGTVIGIKELYHQSPLPFNVEVQNGSKVFALSKSQLFDIVHEKNKKLSSYSIMKKILSI